MHLYSTLPDHHSTDEAQQLREIAMDARIEPVSCLFWWMDCPHVIHAGRRLPDDLLYVPVKGELRCQVGTRSRVIGPGELMMVAAHTPHGAEYATEKKYLEAYSIHLYATDADGRSVLERMSRPFGRLANRSRWFERLATFTHLMGRDQKLGKAFGRHVIRELLLEQISHGTRLADSPPPIDPRIRAALTHISTHCGGDLTVELLARRSRLSTVRFRQLFRKFVGASPKRYVQQVRLNRARSLLQSDPSLTVKEVSQLVGYPDAHYFHALYREAFGETPKGDASSGRPPEPESERSTADEPDSADVPGIPTRRNAGTR